MQAPQEAAACGPHGAAVAPFSLVAARLALAIVLDALAFTVWDVGTRPPAQLVRDVLAGAPRPRSLAAGAIRRDAGASSRSKTPRSGAGSASSHGT